MASFNAKLLFISHFICTTLSAPQQPEINDQFTTTANTVVKHSTEEISSDKLKNVTIATESTKHENQMNKKPEELRKYFIATDERVNEITDIETKPSFIETVYEILTRPIGNFISSPKVSFVLRNVGTCVVNGAMEIIAHYLPAPFIPLIASAAGMVIPFEPVVMLKEKMPVTSYRRAFSKAMNSFLNTFDTYKLDNFDDDPYMTRRFNRRFMNDISEEKKKKSNNDV